MGPLEGVRILDLSRLLPGPFGTSILAALGADVLKLEPPDEGDYARWNPPIKGEQGTFFAALNHDKRSITLNLKHPDAQAVFFRLIESYDVVLEQFRPGVMDRLGLGYTQARQRYPWVIYVSLSGYGQDGPYANRAGHDLNYIALAGILGITGDQAGIPAIPGVQLADVSGGIYAALAVLAAVLKRERTGEGDHVDVSLAESALSMLSMYIDQAELDDKSPGPAQMMLNGRHPCYNVYPTKDGRWMALGALEPKFWAEFVSLIGRPDLTDEGLSVGPRAAEVKAELELIFRSRSMREWVELLADHEVCCEPVLRIDEIRDHPLWAGRQALLRIAHPTEGELSAVRCPARFASQPPAEQRPSPALGQHTEEVLAELGYDEAAIAALRAGKAI